MKKITSFLFTVLVGFGATIAQTTVKLEIIHKIGGNDFSLNTAQKTVDGEDFDITRLQYYLSNFSVTHDSGTVTVFDSVWVLVDASGSTTITLGDAAITQLESVSFSVGVGPNENHLDPSLWPSNHPLAPKNPTMHWGWSAGYRFVAFEGNGGAALNQIYQFHALGDANYLSTEVEVDTMAQTGEVTATIYANYANALKDISVANGLVLHGETGEIVDLMKNFRDYVFSSVAPPKDTTQDTTTSIRTIPIVDARLFPNPSSNGEFTIQLKGNTDISDLTVVDVLGREIEVDWEVVSPGTIHIREVPKGLYSISLQGGEGVTVVKAFSH